MPLKYKKTDGSVFEVLIVEINKYQLETIARDNGIYLSCGVDYSSIDYYI